MAIRQSGNREAGKQPGGTRLWPGSMAESSHRMPEGCCWGGRRADSDGQLFHRRPTTARAETLVGQSRLEAGTSHGCSMCWPTRTRRWPAADDFATSERRRRSCSTSTPRHDPRRARRSVLPWLLRQLLLPLYIFCGRFLLGAIRGRRGHRRPHPARWPKVRRTLTLAPNARLKAVLGLGGSAVVPNHRRGGSAVQGFHPGADRGGLWARAPARRCHPRFVDGQSTKISIGPRRDGKPELDLFPTARRRRPCRPTNCMAYVLLSELRRIALRHTQFADVRLSCCRQGRPRTTRIREERPRRFPRSRP